MKKIAFVLSMAALAGAAFGFDLKDLNPSVGLAGGYASTTRTIEASGTISSTSGSTKTVMTVNSWSVGAFADVTYAEVAVSLTSQIGNTRGEASGTGWGASVSGGEFDSQLLNLSARALGKYPFTFGSLSVFPLVGVEYSANLSAKNVTAPSKASDFNAFYLDLGAGLDYALTDKLYLRVEGLWGLNLTPTMQGAKDSYAASGLNPAFSGSQLAGSLAVGYKL
jgi:hypothetical protein